MHIWLQAMHIMCASKKGFSANQFCRVLGVDFKTGWFLGHRIRLAMDESGSGPLGGEGKTLEIDETFWGKKESGDVVPPYFTNGVGWRGKSRGYSGKIPMVTLVERGGRARSIPPKTLLPPSFARSCLRTPTPRAT